jgi:preprotein translocase subunit SecF
VGPFWGEQITRQAVEALLVFLVVVTIYISLRLEFKMASRRSSRSPTTW